MTIEDNIRVGDIAVMVSLAVSCLFYAFRSGRFAESILTMQREIKELKEVSKSMLVIITEQAVQTVRMDNQAAQLNHLDDKLERIRRGEGLAIDRLIQGPRHG